MFTEVSQKWLIQRVPVQKIQEGEAGPGGKLASCSYIKIPFYLLRILHKTKITEKGGDAVPLDHS